MVRIVEGLRHECPFHVEEEKKKLVKDVHRLDPLGARLEDSPNGGFMVHCNLDSSLVVAVKSKKHIDQILMELKEAVLGKLNESLSQGQVVFLGTKGIMCTRY